MTINVHLRDLCTSLYAEMRSLVSEVEDLPRRNAINELEEAAKLRAIAISIEMARVRFDREIQQITSQYFGASTEVVDLKRFFTSAANEASTNGARA